MSEGLFEIDVASLGWIDDDPENKSDLCAHGDVSVRIGGYAAEHGAAVSASALYLLKTLSRDHIVDGDAEIQLVPCCGFSMYAKEPDGFGETCDISGCPYGIDWTVRHEGDAVRLVAADGTEAVVPFERYKESVFRFADTVAAFYAAHPPRDPSDELDREGFAAFTAEWAMHYEKWGRKYDGCFRVSESGLKTTRRYAIRPSVPRLILRNAVRLLCAVRRTVHHR